jgi:hypothetical protein
MSGHQHRRTKAQWQAAASFAFSFQLILKAGIFPYQEFLAYARIVQADGARLVAMIDGTDRISISMHSGCSGYVLIADA